MRKPVKILENYEETKEKALRILEFRNHSEKEISRKLLQAGAKPEDIEKTIEFLKEYHLINDEAYAKALAHDLQHLKKYGKNRIKSELFEKGISCDIVEEIMSTFSDDEDVLTELVRKRIKNDFDKKNKDKIMRYFIYRGYSADEIRNCINSLEQEKNYD